MNSTEKYYTLADVTSKGSCSGEGKEKKKHLSLWVWFIIIAIVLVVLLVLIHPASFMMKTTTGAMVLNWAKIIIVSIVIALIIVLLIWLGSKSCSK
jgi:uncharacterized membrane protein YcgQ (UPF0703/DUF1980 family)